MERGVEVRFRYLLYAVEPDLHPGSGLVAVILDVEDDVSPVRRILDGSDDELCEHVHLGLDFDIPFEDQCQGIESEDAELRTGGTGEYLTDLDDRILDSAFSYVILEVVGILDGILGPKLVEFETNLRSIVVEHAGDG